MPLSARVACVALVLLAAPAAHAQSPADFAPPSSTLDKLLSITAPGREAQVTCDDVPAGIGRALLDSAATQAGESYERVIHRLRLAERAGRCAGDDTLVGAALNALSDSLLGPARYADAEAVGHESVALHERLQDRAGIAEAWNRVGNAQWWQGKVDDAIAAFNTALAISTAMGDRVGQGRAWNNLAFVHKNRGELDQALDYLSQALAVFEELGDSARAAVVTNNIALNYFGRGEYRTALEYNAKGLELNRAVGTSTRVAASLDARGNIYRALGAYQLALTTFDETLSLRKQIGDTTGRKETTNNIGLVHLSQGEYEQAIVSFKEALRLDRPGADQVFTAEALRNIGAAAWRLGQRERATANFLESLDVVRRNHLRTLEGELLNDLGEMARADGRLIEAASRFDAAVALRRGIPDHAGVTESLTGLAATRLAQRRIGEALELGMRARDNAQEHGHPELLWRALTVTGAAQRALGQTADARSALQQAIGSVEQLSAQSAASTSLDQRFFDDKLSPYHELLALEVDSHNTDVALALAERSKARVLRELLRRDRDASAPVTDDRTEPDRFALHDPASLFHLPNTLALEFVVTDRQLYAFAITSDTGHVVVTPHRVSIIRSDLTARANRLLTRISNRDFGFADDARGMYDLLLRPFAPLLSGRAHLIIVPDGPMWNVPFQALLGPDGYVVETAAVSYAPSLAVLASIDRSRVPGAERRLLALGKSQFDDSLGRPLESLTEAEAQVRELMAMYGPSRTTALLGSDATEARFKAEAPHASIIHLATHGILDDASPLYSYLALTRGTDRAGDDGRLEAWEIMRLKLSADLVVLAACETARGRLAPGEGVVGTMWALLASGARSVVVSQFKVEERSATQVLLGLHRAIAAGQQNRAEHLRTAMLDALHTPRYAHPFYWAGFILVGDGD